VSHFCLNKKNSLKNSSEIDIVFKEGSKLSSKLISLYYVKSKKENHLRFAFSVGKKTHSLATTRNKLKRLMKEALRLNGDEYLDDNLSYNLVFIYFSPNEESFKSIEESMKSLLLSFKNKNLS
jgi:ribonuclease P protein component